MPLVMFEWHLDTAANSAKRTGQRATAPISTVVTVERVNGQSHTPRYASCIENASEMLKINANIADEMHPVRAIRRQPRFTTAMYVEMSPTKLPYVRIERPITSSVSRVHNPIARTTATTSAVSRCRKHRLRIKPANVVSVSMTCRGTMQHIIR